LSIFFEAIGDAADAFIEVELAGNGDDHDSSLPFQEIAHALGAFGACAIIVGADKHQAPGVGRIRIDTNHRNARGNSAIDGVFEEVHARSGNQDARRVFTHGFFKRGQLIFR
jgi:hypothetical protein